MTNKNITRALAMILSILFFLNNGLPVLAEEVVSTLGQDEDLVLEEIENMEAEETAEEEQAAEEEEQAAEEEEQTAEEEEQTAQEEVQAVQTMGNSYTPSYRETPPPSSTINIQNLFDFVEDTGYDTANSNIAVVANNQTHKYGAMWSKTTLDLTQSFETQMYLYMYHQAGGSGTAATLGDGMTFTLHNDLRKSAVIGGDGEGLGVYGSEYYLEYDKTNPNKNAVSVIENALTVEFDLYENFYKNGGTLDHYMQDPSYGTPYGHCALIYPKAPLSKVRIEDTDHLNSFSFTKQAVWYDFSASWVPTIATNGTVGGTLTYTFNGITQTENIEDVTKVFGDTEVYWGFTGSTGGYSSVLAAAITKWPEQIKVEKSVENADGEDIDNAYALEGDILTYTIKVSPTEIVGEIGPVTVEDTLSEYVEYVEVSATITTYGTTSQSSPATPIIEGSTIKVDTGYTFTAENDMLEVTFKVKVNEDSAGENVLNTAIANAKANEYDLSESSNTTKVTIVENPVKKVISENGKDGGEVGVGDELTYEISYLNYEKKAATVVITDKLPEGVDFVSASDGGTCSADTHTVTWTLPDVPGGKSGKVSVVVEVNEKAVVTIENEANVTVGSHDPQTSNKVKNPVLLPFSDDHFAYIIGYEDGTVRPEGHISRAETATIFFRLVTDEYRDRVWSSTNSYSDVENSKWYNNAISTMSNAGVLSGYPNGSFNPDGKITRGELATIIARFVGGEYEGEDKFSDISGQAAKYINIAAEYGWIEGHPGGEFEPDAYITRAEVATIVNRVTGRLPEDEDDLLSGMITWPDNADPSQWYYLAIQEATNSHRYDRKPDGYYEKWTSIQENRNWAELER